MPAIITLTTDFGTRDSYVAQVKGVLLSLGPPALQLVDLGHELAPHDVREGALFLRAAVPRFPDGTIHLAVVDPGVGSARRALAVEVAGQRLVGPDNGLFGWSLAQGARVHQIEAPPGTSAVSSTFHARDVFAPAAARLAHGEPLAALGARVRDALTLAWPEPEAGTDAVQGEVIHVDRFGNLITNIERAHVRLTGARVVAFGRTLPAIRDHYAQVAPGELLALFGSEGLLEIAARDASAARITGAGVGSPVAVELAGGDGAT
jgi:S-adenosylmethionine hydrolase